jgi:MFS family permease
MISGLGAIFFGRVTDKIGPRLLMTFCSLLLGAGYILMALTNTVWQFYLIYGVVIGIGISGFWVPVLSTISRWFSRKRGLMIGVVLTGSGAGTLVLPVIINWLISHYQWRLSIAIIGIITIVVGTLVSQFIKRDPAATGELPDGKKQALSSPGIEHNNGYSLTEAVRTWQFWATIIIFLCCGFYSFTILVHIIPQALYLGLSSTAAANILAVVGGVSILGGLGAGMVADKIGVKKSQIISIIIATISLTWLIVAHQAWQLYLFAIVFGLSFGSIGVLEAICNVWLFGLKANALLLALIDFGMVIGAAIGPVLAGYIFDVTDSYRLAFIFAVALSLAGLILALLLRLPKKAY